MIARPAHIFVCSSLAAALGAYLALVGVAWVFILGLALSFYLLALGLRLQPKSATILVLVFVCGFAGGMVRVTGLFPRSDDISQLHSRSGFLVFSGEVVGCRGGGAGQANILEVAPIKLLSPWSRALAGKVLVRLEAASKSGSEATSEAAIKPLWGGKYIFSGRLIKPSSPVFSFESDGRRRLALRNIFSQVSCAATGVKKLAPGASGEYKEEQEGEEKSAAYSLIVSVGNLRDAIIAAHCAALGEERGKLLTSMVLGDRAVSLSPNIKSTFMRVGLSHLLAASGLNLTIIVGAVVFFFGLRRKYLSRGFSFLSGKNNTSGDSGSSLPQTFCALLCVLFFVSLAGVSPSVTRATIMCLLLLWSTLVFRRLAVGAALSCALYLALLLDPASILDIGLQLSYGATFGIIYFYPIFKAALPQFCSKRPWSWLSALIMVVMAAQLAVLPVQISCFQKISTLVVPANILAEPLVAPITVMGFLSSFLCALARVSHLGCLDPMVFLIDSLSGFFIDLLLSLANFMAASPLAYIYLAQPPVWAVVLYYSLLLWALARGRYRPVCSSVLALLAGGYLTLLSFLLGSAAEVLVSRDSVIVSTWGERPVVITRTGSAAHLPGSGYLPGFHRDFARAYLARVADRGPVRTAACEAGGHFEQSLWGRSVVSIDQCNGDQSDCDFQIKSAFPAAACEVEEAQGVKFYRFKIWGLIKCPTLR